MYGNTKSLCYGHKRRRKSEKYDDHKRQLNCSKHYPDTFYSVSTYHRVHDVLNFITDRNLRVTAPGKAGRKWYLTDRRQSWYIVLNVTLAGEYIGLRNDIHSLKNNVTVSMHYCWEHASSHRKRFYVACKIPATLFRSLYISDHFDKGISTGWYPSWLLIHALGNIIPGNSTSSDSWSSSSLLSLLFVVCFIIVGNRVI